MVKRKVHRGAKWNESRWRNTHLPLSSKGRGEKKRNVEARGSIGTTEFIDGILFLFTSCPSLYVTYIFFFLFYDQLDRKTVPRKNTNDRFRWISAVIRSKSSGGRFIAAVKTRVGRKKEMEEKRKRGATGGRYAFNVKTLVNRPISRCASIEDKSKGYANPVVILYFFMTFARRVCIH